MKINQPRNIYITNTKHKLYGIGSFTILFHTNAGYTVKFAGEFYQVGANEAKILPNED